MDCRGGGWVWGLYCICLKPPSLAHWLSGSGGIKKKLHRFLQHRLDYSLPAICFFTQSLLFDSSCIICDPLLYEWSLCGCFCAFILSFLLAIYHSWWPLEDGEERRAAPLDSPQSSFCRSSPSFSLFFSVKTQTALPVIHSEITTMQRMSGI